MFPDGRIGRRFASVALTLMAETVPSRHRGWMLVLLGGIGTTGGYLAASLCAAWLEPRFGWRVLWFLNFPTGLLLMSVSGVIAMLIPYATEIYPLQVRGTGSGLVAGSCKAGGIAAAGLGVMGLFGSLTASALIIAAVLAASAVLLAVKGVETRNRDLEHIHPGDSILPAEK